jgi:hypothetical protein
VLDADDDTEVDLSSRALQIWNSAVEGNPALARAIEALPPVVFSARRHDALPEKPQGVVVYLRTSEGTDALAWMNDDGVARHPVARADPAKCRVHA